jgi:hypothetical protein
MVEQMKQILTNIAKQELTGKDNAAGYYTKLEEIYNSSWGALLDSFIMACKQEGFSGYDCIKWYAGRVSRGKAL